MIKLPTLVTATPTWERTAVATSRDDVALHIAITGEPQPARPETTQTPVDIAFVIDRSGSMSGGKLDLVRQATIQAISMLQPWHRAGVVAFDDKVQVVAPLTTMTPTARQDLQRRVGGIHEGGSTYLSGGWLSGCQLLSEVDGHAAKRVVLLTDGMANVGITLPTELAHHASELRRRGIVTSTMGVGHGFDELLLSGMAEAGGGNFRFLNWPEDFVAMFNAETRDLVDIVAERPELSITLPAGYRATLLNAFPSRRDGKTITVELRDLAAGERIDLVFVVTHIGRIAETARVGAEISAIMPGSDLRVAQPIRIKRLKRVPDHEAASAPIDHGVAALRAREQAGLDQREALRLDREGRYDESRQVFARSRDILSFASARASAAGYHAPIISDLDTETRRLEELSHAPAAPLGEAVHKERVAHRAATSRGRRRPE